MSRWTLDKRVDTYEQAAKHKRSKTSKVKEVKIRKRSLRTGDVYDVLVRSRPGSSAPDLSARTPTVD